MTVTPIYRRMNAAKAEIDITDDVIMKFEKFWSDFKNAPLKGKHPIYNNI